MTNELEHIKDSRAAIGGYVIDIYNEQIDRTISSVRQEIEELQALLLRGKETGDTDNRKLRNDGTVGSR